MGVRLLHNHICYVCRTGAFCGSLFCCLLVNLKSWNSRQEKKRYVGSVNSDFAGIKNWFNEFYAHDTSRKIHAVQKSKGEKGIPLTVNLPYGYVKDPNDPHHWIINPEAALVVKHIFTMCMEGRGPSQIANRLRTDKVLTPTVYKRQHGRETPQPLPENPYKWHNSSVVSTLERREYTGCTVNVKTYINSIWDKKQRETPLENQVVFLDTHERIIEDDVFAKVQEIRQQRHRMTGSGRTSMFSGLVYCADCGARMNYSSTNNYKPQQAQRKHPHQVRRHRIYPAGCAYERKNGVTEVTPFPENMQFS